MVNMNSANRIKSKLSFDSISISFSSITFSNLKINNINSGH